MKKFKKVKQLQTSESLLGLPPGVCTMCKTQTAFTEDWTLYPWPDGAWLCNHCNEERFHTEDYDEVEALARIKFALAVSAQPTARCPRCIKEGNTGQCTHVQ